MLIFAVAILYIVLKYQQKELHKINMLNKEVYKRANQTVCRAERHSDGAEKVQARLWGSSDGDI